MNILVFDAKIRFYFDTSKYLEMYFAIHLLSENGGQAIMSELVIIMGDLVEGGK